MESLLPLIIQLVGGAAGGNVAGALLKNVSLGSVGNSVVGALGGAGSAYALGPIIGNMLGGGGGGIMDIIGQAADGGIGGLVLTVVVGLIKSMMAK